MSLNRIRCIAVLAATICLGSVMADARADSGKSPPSLEGAKTVTTDEVAGLLGKVTILDVRRKASFLEGHIPGAKSIVGQFNKERKVFDPIAFGPDKSAPIVIHGHGSDGWSAVYAVRSAVAAGYSDVRWMRAGWAEWSHKKLPVNQ